MNDVPNSLAASADFEFQALAQARNYRQAILTEFARVLQGNVLEVGAGIGQITERLAALPRVNRALAVEPDPVFCARHRAVHPKHEILQGTASDIPPGTNWNALLSVNVLEHIRDDQEELKRYAELLRPGQGVLCLFVPARPEIYAPIDKDFGHFRRYTRFELGRKLADAGFNVTRLSYFNIVGYFAWWFNFCILKERVFRAGKIRFYDRAVFPFVHALESRLWRPPLGQSLLAEAVVPSSAGAALH
jgi:SAM-dependent methyltransferase